MRFFLDSSAWVEYLEGSSKGGKVSQILEEDNEIYSIPLIISEVVSRAKRKKQNVEVSFRAITINSKILEINPDRIVYVSCNPATQARDLILLCEKYKVTKIQPVDMFPQTQHIECVSVLDR